MGVDEVLLCTLRDQVPLGKRGRRCGAQTRWTTSIRSCDLCRRGSIRPCCHYRPPAVYPKTRAYDAWVTCHHPRRVHRDKSTHPGRVYRGARSVMREGGRYLEQMAVNAEARNPGSDLYLMISMRTRGWTGRGGAPTMSRQPRVPRSSYSAPRCTGIARHANEFVWTSPSILFGVSEERGYGRREDLSECGAKDCDMWSRHRLGFTYTGEYELPRSCNFSWVMCRGGGNLDPSRFRADLVFGSISGGQNFLIHFAASTEGVLRISFARFSAQN